MSNHKQKVGAYSDQGPRENNQDSLWTPKRDETLISEKGEIFIVSDGVGGHAFGEVASTIAVQQVPVYYQQAAQADVQQTLNSAIENANRIIYEASQKIKVTRGMACTIATVVIQNQQAYIANVGDSRIYLIRNNQVILLSQDHTFVADQVRAGKMTEEEAERSDRKHVITRSLGIQPTVEVYHSTIELREDDWLLLCSDGLYGVLDEVDFVEAINTFEAPQKTAKALVNEALVRGTNDNVSCVLVGPIVFSNLYDDVEKTISLVSIARPRLVSGSKATIPETSLEPNRPFYRSVLVSIAVIILLAGVGTTFLILINSDASLSTSTELQGLVEYFSKGAVTQEMQSSEKLGRHETPALVIDEKDDALLELTPVTSSTSVTLLEPLNGSVFTADEAINLFWTAPGLEPGQVYWVTLEQDQQLFLREARTETTLFLEPLPPGNYSWHVQFADQTEEPLWNPSEALVFSVSPAPKAIPTDEPGTTVTATAEVTQTLVVAASEPENAVNGAFQINAFQEAVRQADFKWYYDGPLTENQGFEVRLWSDGAAPQSVHNAIDDNKNGLITMTSDGGFSLSLDITNSVPVQGVSDSYWWAVYLIQIEPDYQLLGPQSTPSKFNFFTEKPSEVQSEGEPEF